MTALIWPEAHGGPGCRITVPADVAPGEAARTLADRLRALSGRMATAWAPGQRGEGEGRDGQRAPTRMPVVAIDGYSGSGKTTLARALVRLLEAWQVLHMDDWYPGWDGLEVGATIARRIAADLRAGRSSSYVAWDWEEDAPGEAKAVSALPTIIEGCGAIDVDADLTIWLAYPGQAVRRRRALTRDGATYAPHWQRWADQDLGRFVN